MSALGKTRSRTIGWGHRAVTFVPVATHPGAWAAESYNRWEATRNGTRVAVYPRARGSALGDTGWAVGWVEGDGSDSSIGAELALADTLDDALVIARAWLLGLEQAP